MSHGGEQLMLIHKNCSTERRNSRYSFPGITSSLAEPMAYMSYRTGSTSWLTCVHGDLHEALAAS